MDLPASLRSRTKRETAGYITPGPRVVMARPAHAPHEQRVSPGLGSEGLSDVLNAVRVAVYMYRLRRVIRV